MRLEDEQRMVRQALDNALSGISEDPAMTARVLAQSKGETPMKRKLPMAVIVLIVLLITTATAVAAGWFAWNRGLEDQLRVTDEIKSTFSGTGLFEHPEMSVTQNGVTVSLDSCVVVESSAYIAFRVSGYQPRSNMQPAFDETEIICSAFDNASGGTGGSFFDGLVTGPDGRSMFTDGTPWSEDRQAQYTDERGDMIYIISINVDGSSLIGQEISIELRNLGYYFNQWGDVQVEVEGTWAFEWQLTGTDACYELHDVSLPLGDTGITLTDLRLSPISIEVTLQNVPADRVEGDEDLLVYEPYICCLRRRDGTIDYWVANGGSFGLLDDGYRMSFALDRVVIPSEIESIFFSFVNAEIPDLPLIPGTDTHAVEVKIR